MNRDVRLLLKAHDTVCKSGDVVAFRSAKANLKWGIQSTKHQHKLKTEGHFKNCDVFGRNTISLPDEVNNFYARIKDNTTTAISHHLS